MSSAPPRTMPRIGALLRGTGWTVVLAAMAVGGAGLVDQAWHAPGSPARAELTYAGDRALAVRLDAAAEQLRKISADVDELGKDAKTALEEVASTDPSRLRDALQRGGLAATAIAGETKDLQDTLAGLPGDGPAAAFEYSNDTLVRRAAILAALDAATSVATQWETVTGRAVDAAHLVSLIDQHDQTFLSAAAKGVNRQYSQGAAILDDALLTIGQVQEVRNKLIAGSDPTVLDEWIQRTTAYDLAVKAVYVALDKSGGVVTIEVQSARREEQIALAQLPPDRRTILVIVSEVARGGLTQAILAIDEAHARIDDALAGPPAATP